MKKLRDMTDFDFDRMQESDIDYLTEKVNLANDIINRLPSVIKNYKDEAFREVPDEEIDPKVRKKVKRISDKIVKTKESNRFKK